MDFKWYDFTENVKNITACEKWGIFNDNRNYKQTVSNNQKDKVHFLRILWEKKMETLASTGNGKSKVSLVLSRYLHVVIEFCTISKQRLQVANM